jgi:hypothetical protein
MRFREEHTFAERKAESDRIRAKYPDRIPVICEKTDKSQVQVRFSSFPSYFQCCETGLLMMN